MSGVRCQVSSVVCGVWRVLFGTSRIQRLLVVLFVAFLACMLASCSMPVSDVGQGDFGEFHWHIREVTKGEIVPLEGPHQHFEVFEQPFPIEIEHSRFQIEFELADGRKRAVIFEVRFLGAQMIEIGCPQANLAPNAEALSRQDRLLNEAISGHVPVNASANQWTTFFNDNLRGVFSSDWQLWWGELAPER